MMTSKGSTPAAQSSNDPIKDKDDDDDTYFDSEEDDGDMYETMDDAPMQIEQGLFIGSFLSEQNLQGLKQAGITHVLQVAEGLQPSHTEEFTYRNINVQDAPSEDLVAHFSKCFNFIDDAIKEKGGVLVHCVAGVSRSATVCIGYLMWKHKLPYDEAFRRVHSVRPWVMPNEGFRKQLEEFEKLSYDLAKWKAWRHVWKEECQFTVSIDRHQQKALEDFFL